MSSDFEPDVAQAIAALIIYGPNRNTVTVDGRTLYEVPGSNGTAYQVGEGASRA